MSRQACRGRGLAPLGVLVALAALWPARSSAEARGAVEVVERVVAVVDEEPLFLSELRRRAVPFFPRVLSAPLGQREALLEQLYRELLQKMIDEKLIELEARKLEVRVTPSEIEEAIGRVRRQSGLSEDEFWATLRDSGMDPRAYREEVRRQLLRLKVVGRKLRGRVDVSEEDVRRLYEERVRDARSSLRFHAAHCLLRFPPQATAEQVAAIRQEAEAVAGSGDPQRFERCVAEHGGGDLGWLQQGDLPEAFERLLTTLQPGQLGGPVRGPSGYHVFLLHEREEGGEVPSFEQMKGQLFRELLDRRMAEQERDFLKELRARARIEVRL